MSLLGVKRTTSGGKLHLCLRRSDLLKILRPTRVEKRAGVNTGVNPMAENHKN
jgi:hypothetical protein